MHFDDSHQIFEAFRDMVEVGTDRDTCTVALFDPFVPFVYRCKII
jgi:hypothetical protein